MDNFDNLTNEELRLKLLEYGLANMPVTQTTRKVLIKKLKNHLENASSKTRRETIHVTKYSSDEDVSDNASETKKAPKKETNRRATIAASATKLSKTLPVMPDLPPPKSQNVSDKPEKVNPTQKRRSSRSTPVFDKEDKSSAAPSEPMIVEYSDEEYELPLSQVKDKQRKPQKSSLSNAQTLTTSYVHHIEVAKPPIVEEMQIDLTESTDEVVEEPPVDIPVKSKGYSQSTTFRTDHNETSSSVTSKRKATITGTTLGLTPTRRSEFSNSFGRSSLASSYAYIPPSASSVQRDEIKLDPSDSPYLSEFTKRLSRLKAESAQLNAVRDHPVRRTIAASYPAQSSRAVNGEEYVQSRLTTVRGRGQIHHKNDIRDSIRQLILALDQKYSIKKAFYILILVMIVIFLFVFFFM